MNKKYLSKIIATDNEGLQVISACCSGAEVKVDEIKYLQSNKVFLLSLNRSKVETDEKDKKVTSICKFEFVDKVKSKNIHALSKILVNEYNSRIPKTIEELVKLPGVGRKTASVFLAETFDQPTIAVDTHVLRVSHRLGLSTKRHDPIQTEKELKLLFPKDFWRYLSMSFVQFGRDICDAKKPLCEVCDFNNSCKYYSSLNT